MFVCGCVPVCVCFSVYVCVLNYSEWIFLCMCFVLFQYVVCCLKSELGKTVNPKANKGYIQLPYLFQCVCVFACTYKS